jgi:hypothetical protein
MYLAEQAEDGLSPVTAKEVEIIEGLLVGEKAHDACLFPFSSISRMPSFRMITIPCRSSVMPRSS